MKDVPVDVWARRCDADQCDLSQGAIIFTSRLADVHCNIALLPICTFIDDDGDSQTEPALGPGDL